MNKLTLAATILLATTHCNLLSAQITDHTWNGGTGNWSDSSRWDTGSSPNGGVNIFIDGGKQGNSNVFLDMDVSINNIMIDNNDILTIEDGKSLVVNGDTMSINGLLSLQSAGVDTDLVIGGANVVFGGTGAIELGDSANNRIYGSASTNFFVNDATVRGAGQIGMATLQIENNGLIEANSANNALEIHATSNVLNAGELLATGGGKLRLKAGNYDNELGKIRAENNSIVELWDGAIIDRGELTTSGTGAIRTFPANTGSVTLKGVKNSGEFRVSDGTDVVLEGVIENNGSIIVAANNSATTLWADGNAGVQLNGTGKVILTETTTNQLAKLDTLAGSKWVVGEYMTIEGTGVINGDLTNKGVISANVPHATHTLKLTGVISNELNASLQATNGGTLVIENDVSGLGYIDAVNNSRVVITNNANISTDIVGDITSIIQFQDSTFDGQLWVESVVTGTLNLKNLDLYNLVLGKANSDIIVPGAIWVGDFVNGIIRLESGAEIAGDALPGTDELETEIRIQGEGRIGGGFDGIVANDLKVKNYGSIRANGLTSLEVNTGTETLELDRNGYLIADGAVLEVANSNDQFVNGRNNRLSDGNYHVLNGGTIQIENLNIVSLDAEIKLDGMGASIEDFGGNNALRNLSVMEPASRLEISKDAELILDGPLELNSSRLLILNDGKLLVGPTGHLDATTTYTKDFVGYIHVYGTVDVGTFYNRHFSLYGSGQIDGNLVIGNGSGTEPSGSLYIRNFDYAIQDFEINGNYTQESNTTLYIELGGTASGEFDHLDISGVAQLGGALNIRFHESYLPSFGDQFQIITTAPDGVIGNFDSVTGPSGYSWQVDYQGDNVTITAMAAVPEPSTYAMMSLLAVVGFVWYRRKKKISEAMN